MAEMRGQDFVVGLAYGVALGFLVFALAVAFGWVCWCLRPMVF